MSTSYDAVIVGGGIVGAACALALAREHMRVAIIERGTIGGGASAAGMGHIVVLDGSEAEFALSSRSQTLWQQLAADLPRTSEYAQTGTLWVAADEEELSEAERKLAYLQQHNLPGAMLNAKGISEAEPNLRPGLTGGLVVRQDSVVFPPTVAAYLIEKSISLGATLLRANVTHLANGEARLDNGTTLHAPRLINAAGAEAYFCNPSIPIQKRKGHLAITDRYPGFLRHQVVELGYMKSAHSITADSVACNLQPRITGQVLIGSSRQFGVDDPTVEHTILSRMLRRSLEYMPALAHCKIIRTWTGFRAATPDKLPLIGPVPSDSTLWLATGHEGLGITTSLATAELLADTFAGHQTAIPAEPYLPARLLAEQTQPIKEHQ